jgi:hypothetical protein
MKGRILAQLKGRAFVKLLNDRYREMYRSVEGRVLPIADRQRAGQKLPLENRAYRARIILSIKVCLTNVLGAKDRVASFRYLSIEVTASLKRLESNSFSTA